MNNAGVFLFCFFNYKFAHGIIRRQTRLCALTQAPLVNRFHPSALSAPGRASARSAIVNDKNKKIRTRTVMKNTKQDSTHGHTAGEKTAEGLHPTGASSHSSPGGCESLSVGHSLSSLSSLKQPPAAAASSSSSAAAFVFSREFRSSLSL